MMSGRFKQAVIVHGILLPAVARLFIIGLLGGAGYVFEAERDFRIARHTAHEKRKAEIAEIDSYMAPRRRDASAWGEILKSSSVRAAVASASSAAAEFPPEDLTTTEMTQMQGESPAALGVREQAHSRLQVGFEGGLGPVQKLSHALEWGMPQLLCEGLEAQRNNKGSLTARLRFMLWRADQESAQKGGQQR